MSEAQKALDAILLIKPHLGGMGGSIRTGSLGVACKEHLNPIERALKLLAAVEGGTHKVVPEWPTREMAEAFDDEFSEMDGTLFSAIAKANEAAPDFFGKKP